MRKHEREVTELAEQLAIMERCDVCRLALNGEDGYPYLLPLNFGIREENGRVCLLFHGAVEGTKFALMERDSRASFEMDCAHELDYQEERGYCTMYYESIIGRGRLRILDDDEKEAALDAIMMHYHPENVEYNHAAIPRTTCYMLEVEQMTGKRKVQKKKRG